MPARDLGSAVLTCARVDGEAIVLKGPDVPVDVSFDGRRIFSFWVERDTEHAGHDRVMRWPAVLARFLDGQAEVSLAEHGSSRPFWSGPVRFGTGAGPIRIEDSHGNPMGLDKSNRLTRLFDTRTPEALAPLLDSIRTVLDAVGAAGLEPFLAYGTLLGAVRDQAFIGHDSDADIGYLSRFTHPADAVSESFRVQRRLIDMGYQTSRYSGLAFKVTVHEGDGRPRGLDVFGGLMVGDRLYLMGEVGAPFRPEWIHPLGQATLAGRRFPVPAEPGRLLEAMYGPSWRVPDPAFKFTTSRETQRRLSGWFRGTRVGLDRRWTQLREHGAEPRLPKKSEPTAFARWVHEREPGMATVVDVGCGRGQDVLWFASVGVEALGLDHFPRGYGVAARRAAKKSLPARFERTNLNELRSVLAAGAELSRLPGPCIMTARHLADDTNAMGRENLLRLAKMATRDRGRLYVQMQPTSVGEGTRAPVDLVECFLAQAQKLGGRVEFREDVAADRAEGSVVSRLVIAWHRRT